MKIIPQIGLLFGLCWLAQCVEGALPFPLPSSVIGLILLLILLAAKFVRAHHIRETSDFLLGNLPFFFVPVSVSIMKYMDLIRENAAAFFVICVVSTVLTFGATAGAVTMTIRLMRRERR